MVCWRWSSRCETWKNREIMITQKRSSRTLQQFPATAPSCLSPQCTGLLMSVNGAMGIQYDISSRSQQPGRPWGGGQEGLDPLPMVFRCSNYITTYLQLILNCFEYRLAIENGWPTFCRSDYGTLLIYSVKPLWYIFPYPTMIDSCKKNTHAFHLWSGKQVILRDAWTGVHGSRIVHEYYTIYTSRVSCQKGLICHA